MATIPIDNLETSGQSTLKEFFRNQLQEIYRAEQALVQALPRLREAVSEDELKRVFEEMKTKKPLSR
jgi:ferritin-like metal-binding protein YciE